MGYRSDVTVLVYGDVLKTTAYVEAWKKRCRESNDEDVQSIADEFNEVDVQDNYAFYNMNMTSVKWYDSFPDVMAVEQLLEGLNQVTGVCAEIARVGEDPDDTAHDTYGDPDELGYYVRINRSIEVTY